MNILISIDMEGIAGVVSGNHASSDHKEYERFRKPMTAEANAAIEWTGDDMPTVYKVFRAMTTLAWSA